MRVNELAKKYQTKKAEAAASNQLTFTTDAEHIDFNFDDLKKEYAKRNLKRDDVDSVRASGSIKWEMTVKTKIDGVESLALAVPDNQHITIIITKYVDEEGTETEEIEEEITLKNVEVDLYEDVETEYNRLVLNLCLDSIIWSEEHTILRFRFRGGDI